MKNIKNIVLFLVLHLTLWVNGQTCFEVLKNDFKAVDATQDFKNFVGSDPDALYIYASLSTASKSVRTDLKVLQFYKKLTNSNLDAFGSQLIQKLDDTKLKSFANDFKNADVADLNKLAANNGELVEVWKKVSYLLVEAKEVDFLTALKKVQDDDVWKHILGEVHSPTFANGGHILINISKINIGGELWIYSDKIRFKVSDIRIPSPWTDGDEILKARRIEIFNGNQWIPKSNGGASSFFPSAWTKEQILEETALAFKKAKNNPSTYWTGNGNAYDVLSSDGSLTIRFFYGSNGEVNPLLTGTSMPIIKSSFPIF